MSYSAPNTPNPTLATQIGYSFQLPINFVPTSLSDSTIISTSAIPIGVWTIGSTVYGSGLAQDNVMLEAAISIFNGSTTTPSIGVAGYSSITPFIYVYLPLNATFYSDGSTILTIGLSIAMTTVDGLITGNLTFTKIA